MKILNTVLGPLLSGILFSIGLGVSGMTESKNIIAFLDIFGVWQGELMLVMAGAIIVYAVLYRLIVCRSKPLFENSFSIPHNKTLDKRLIFGAIFFGIGWGVTGLCPGPGLVALVSGKTNALVFVFTMILGMFVGRSNFGTKILSRAKQK